MNVIAYPFSIIHVPWAGFGCLFQPVEPTENSAIMTMQQLSTQIIKIMKEKSRTIIWADFMVSNSSVQHTGSQSKTLPKS